MPSKQQQTKKCTKCGKIKPITEFNKRSNRPLKLQSRCKDCQKEYYQQNKEQHKKWHKQYYQKNREKILQHQKEYLKKNRKKRRSWERHYYTSTVVNGENVKLYGKKRQRPNDNTCETCKKQTKTLHYHHWNNNNLLQGIWVCPKCHRIIEAYCEKEFNKIVNSFKELRQKIKDKY